MFFLFASFVKSHFSSLNSEILEIYTFHDAFTHLTPTGTEVCQLYSEGGVIQQRKIQFFNSNFNFFYLLFLRAKRNVIFSHGMDSIN